MLDGVVRWLKLLSWRTKSYDVTIQMKALCLYSYIHGAIHFSKFHKMKFGNLVEICFWPNLAVKGLKPLRRFVAAVSFCKISFNVLVYKRLLLSSLLFLVRAIILWLLFLKLVVTLDYFYRLQLYPDQLMICPYNIIIHYVKNNDEAFYIELLQILKNMAVNTRFPW